MTHLPHRSTHPTRLPQIGSNILRQMADMYRKVRGTLRFLLGNLADYDPRAHAVPYDQLPALDRFLLYRTAQINKELAAAYDTYQVGAAARWGWPAPAGPAGCWPGTAI